MDKPSTETDREGRLIAHRTILQVLMREVAARSADPEHLWTALQDLYQFQDHEEDPGVIPSEAYGIEAAAAAEIRRLVEGAQKG